MGKHVRPRREDRALTERICVAGCGRMGRPMLAALLDAGFDAVGYDISPVSADVDSGTVTDNAAIASVRTRILLTVVRDAAQTDDVLFGHGNFVEQAGELDTLVIASTLSPRYIQTLRDRIASHVSIVDAPMSGAQVAANERRLSFMLGGSAMDLDRLQPAFNAMGNHFHRMGELGAGMQAKVLNNLLAASSTAMTRLVLDWADRSGLDEKQLLDLIHTSSGQNWLASGFDEIEFSRDGWEPDNTIGILTKDIEAALDAAPNDANVHLPKAVHRAIRALSARPRQK